MQTLVIQTQCRENYGVHDWDGKGECPQHWKFKGGNTYFVIHLTSGQSNKIANGGIHPTDPIEYKGEMFKNISGLGDPDLVKMATARVPIGEPETVQNFIGVEIRQGVHQLHSRTPNIVAGTGIIGKAGAMDSPRVRSDYRWSHKTQEWLVPDPSRCSNSKKRSKKRHKPLTRTYFFSGIIVV